MVRWNFPAEIGSNERSFRVKYSVEDLLPQDASRWDKLIAADLARELEGQLGEKAECAGRPARSRWCKSITMKE